MRKWYNKEKLTESELYILVLVEPNIVKLEELGGDIVMEEYVDEAEDVALHNGFGQSYDHEEADREAFREIAYVQGKEEGREEGIKIRNIDIARNLLNLKISISDIVKATGLTEKEIKNL